MFSAILTGSSGFLKIARSPVQPRDCPLDGKPLPNAVSVPIRRSDGAADSPEFLRTVRRNPSWGVPHRCPDPSQFPNSPTTKPAEKPSCEFPASTSTVAYSARSRRTVRSGSREGSGDIGGPSGRVMGTPPSTVLRPLDWAQIVAWRMGGLDQHRPASAVVWVSVLG